MVYEMINDDSVGQIENAGWSGPFMQPLYGSYCFAQIPALLRSVFALDGDSRPPVNMLGESFDHYDRVVLFFVDGFGWRFFERYRDDYPFLRRFVREGMVTKLTSQFPSTTAAHVTAIHTGLPVGQSGIYEWTYYEPLVDALIAPLLYSYAGDHARNTLMGAPITPADLFPTRTLYDDLCDGGVRSFVFQHQEYTPSPYSDVVFSGSYVVPYATLPEALVMLSDLLVAQRERAYFFLYFDKIDSVCHRHGPSSRQAHAEIDAFLTTMEHVFCEAMAGKLARTLVLLTADHGQVDIDPHTTIYLNQQWPEIAARLRTNRAGQILAPAGSPRDLFLYVEEGLLEETQAELQQRLDGRAMVCRAADLVEQGFFGLEEPSPALLGRLGNLVVLPYDGESVWWYEKGRFEQSYYGHHGGLTRSEMETLLLALPQGM